VEQPRLQAQNQYEGVKQTILAHRDGERILAAFDALNDPQADAVSAG